MKLTLSLDLDVDYDIEPAHEGTTDEIIPERVNVKQVLLNGLDITQSLSSDDIEELEGQLINELY